MLLRGAVDGCGSHRRAWRSSAARMMPSRRRATATPTRRRAAGRRVTPTGPCASAGWVPVQPSAESPAARRDHSLTRPDIRHRCTSSVVGSAANALERPLAVRSETDIVGAGSTLTRRPPARFAHNAIFDAREPAGSSHHGPGRHRRSSTTSGCSTRRRMRGANRAVAVSDRRRATARAARTMLRRRLLMSHGFTDSGRFDDTWTVTWQRCAWEKIARVRSRAVKRCLHRTLCCPAGTRCCCSAVRPTATPFLGDFWSLDVAAGTWSQQRRRRRRGRETCTALASTSGDALVRLGRQHAGRAVGRDVGLRFGVGCLGHGRGSGVVLYSAAAIQL